MKKNKMICWLCIFLVCTLCFSACGSNQEADNNSNTVNTKENQGNDSSELSNENKDDKNSSDIKSNNDTDNTTDDGNVDVTPEVVPQMSYFTASSTNADRMVQEAKEQFEAGDYTRLDEPVKYNVLWLGFSHVTYEDLDFQMTDFDKEYLQAVTLNYEKSLESITDHNLDITVDLHIIDDVTPLTKYYDDDWLFLAQETVQPYIDKYNTNNQFDTVLTAVETAGDENVLRNSDKDGYGINYVMLGLCTSNMNSDMGYSTFDLGKPIEGTYPLADPEIPSLYATSVAVHEWMHQLEYMGTLLGIEYPNTHAYMGPESFPGYKQYINGENDYDFFEFYKLVLTGKLPFDNGSSVELVGMYPKMWPLIKRDVYRLGTFTVKAADGNGYFAGRDDEPRLYISDTPCIWNIKYIGDGKFVFTPAEMPDKLIDLGNAWDLEDNTISLWVYTGYVDAQSWHVIDNTDGSYSIQTPYESGRLLTIRGDKGALLCSNGAEGIQKWKIEPAAK